MHPTPNAPLPQRKRPVHMMPVARHNEPIILFVTIGLQPRVPALANAAFRDAFVRACGDADVWSVGRYVIMPDHVHLFCGPAREPRVGIKRWCGYLKRRITIYWSENADGSREPARVDARPPGGNIEGALQDQMEGERPASRPDRDCQDGGLDEWTLDQTNGGRASTRAAVPFHWQPDCWDTQLRNADHYHETWEYVRLNPLRKGLVTRPEDWPWQGELNVLRW